MLSASFNKNCRILYWCANKFLKRYHLRKNSTKSSYRSTDFGIIFDVDGVLTRGPIAIPAALRASELLNERNGDWRVPVLFLTNASNISNETKAAEISRILHKKVFF